MDKENVVREIKEKEITNTKSKISYLVYGRDRYDLETNMHIEVSDDTAEKAYEVFKKVVELTSATEGVDEFKVVETEVNKRANRAVEVG